MIFRRTIQNALLLVASVPACWSAEPGYLNSSVCASCHREAAEGYARSGMAGTFGVVGPDTAAARVPLAQFHDHRAEQEFAVSRQNGRLYLRRSTVGYDGKPADVLEAEMAYWIGSGNHARSYLSRETSGKLVELPLTWYSAGGGHWAMSPGYDVPFHAGFSRKITYACLFCHAGYPDLPPGTDEYDGGWKLPAPPTQGIDCQRCHGPGQAHLDAVQQGGTPAQVRAAIVNPKKLAPLRGMEICMQCHLETTTVQLPGFLRKYDRATFSYRAGEPLQDFVLHFEQAPGTGQDRRLEFVGEAYRLRMSACFRESKGSLTCMTCHNPHNIPRGEAAVRYYSGICQGCHRETVAKLVRAGQHAASQDCMSCHMPKRKPVDALNTLISDHFIRKRPDPEPAGIRVEYNDSTALPYRGEVMPYYPPTLAGTPENELYLAVAQVKNRANLAAGVPRLEALIARIQPPQGAFYLDLAEALNQVGKPEAAIPYARQAVQQMPEKWRSWFALGSLLIAAGDPSQAVEALKHSVTLAPDEPTASQKLGEAYGRQGKFTDALAAFRSAVAADPAFAEGHNNLGTTLLRLGDAVAAERELREAVRLRPESSAMQLNLASCLARPGLVPEARHRFELALKLNPGYAEGHSLYGAVLAANREWAASRSQLEEAVKLNSKSAVTHHNLGVVLMELRDTNGALRQFQSAVDLDPNYYEAHLKLGQLLVENGKRAEAQPHLLKATESPDEQVKQAAARLLQN
jgi:predicted CXXCH cytochrome family protein